MKLVRRQKVFIESFWGREVQHEESIHCRASTKQATECYSSSRVQVSDEK